METPGEGITQLWMSITVDRIKELQEAGDFDKALSELRLRRHGLQETLSQSPVEGLTEQLTATIQQELQVITEEIEKLDILEQALVVLMLQSRQAEIVEILATDAEGDQAALLREAERIHGELQKLETND